MKRKRRLDANTPQLPREARQKLDVLRPAIVEAFMAGRMDEWHKLTDEAALILRLSGIDSKEEIALKTGAKIAAIKRQKRN